MAKVTVAKYKSPSGYYVDGKGVIPNIEVQDDSLSQFGPDKILALTATKKYKKAIWIWKYLLLSKDFII